MNGSPGQEKLQEFRTETVVLVRDHWGSRVSIRKIHVLDHLCKLVKVS